MRTAKRFFPLLLLATLAFAGCHELGHLGDVGDYGSSSAANVAGEVRHIDSRAREIELRTDGGRTRTIRYDDQTRVVYRQRDYAVSNLEPGDYVAMRVEQDRNGRFYTNQITVRENVQERGAGRLGRADRLEGSVEYIDSRRGLFELRSRQNRLVLVTLPYNAPRSVSDRFNRLREGDFVRVEGRFVNQERFELESFA